MREKGGWGWLCTICDFRFRIQSFLQTNEIETNVLYLYTNNPILNNILPQVPNTKSPISTSPEPPSRTPDSALKKRVARISGKESEPEVRSCRKSFKISRYTLTLSGKKIKNVVLAQAEGYNTQVRFWLDGCPGFPRGMVVD